MFGTSLLGGHLSSRRAKKDKRSLQKRITKSINATESIKGRGLSQQEALTRQATQQRLGGYDAAKREASRLGRGAKQGALDRGTQLEARASQSLANRGLGSTTAGTNLSRGIQADTSRVMGGIDEGLAGMYGDLALGRAGAEAAGSEKLGDFAAQRGDMMSQLAQMRLLGGGQLGQMQAPMGSVQSGFEMALPGMSEAFGQYMGGAGGGDQNAQLMAMLQKLFSQGGGGQGFQYPGTMVGAPLG